MAIKNSEIAQRLKAIRLLSDVTVEEISKAAGLTESEYETLESGDVSIPVSALLAVCDYLNISMTELLTGETAKLHTYSFVKRGRGLNVERTKAYKYENLAFNFAGRKIEPLLVTVDPNDSEEIHTNTHSGHEFHFGLEGRFLLKIGDHTLTVEEGDSVYFDSSNPHGMKALDGKSAKILVITI